MFRPFRRFLDALDHLEDGIASLSAVLRDLNAYQAERGPAIDRLEALETSRHQWEAMCEGLLMKAEGKLRAANNAEARERANKKSYEHLLDPLAEDGGDGLPPQGSVDTIHDAAAREEERVHALRLDVAPTGTALARRAKFGVR